MVKYYFLSKEAVEQSLKTNIRNGLRADQIAERKHRYGDNQLPSAKADSYITLFLKQFQDPLIYLLLIAAVIIFFIESGRDALFITGILILNAIVGTYQEGKASYILASLRNLIKTKTIVIRDSKRQLIDAADIVPGDLVVLQEGDFIPADIRLVDVYNLATDESTITGESHHVKKIATALPEDASGDVPLYQQKNIVFAGSYVLHGHGQGLVVNTGEQTIMGGMQKEVVNFDTKMPLKSEIERVAHLVLWYVFGIIAFLFILGWVQGSSIKSLLSMLAALFICVIPEGLPVIFTLILAMGVDRMAKKHMLVKRLQAIEGLGRINILGIDKTGTLTHNELAVQEIYAPSGNNALLPPIAAVMSQAYVNETQRKGDAIEVALSAFAHKHGVSKTTITSDSLILQELPFDHTHTIKISFLKAQKTFSFSGDNASYLAVITGAPEVLIEASRADTLDQAQTHLEQFLTQGMRVVAAAYTPIDEVQWQQMQTSLAHEDYAHIAQSIRAGKNLVFAGLFAFGDRLREEASLVLDEARRYGVRPIMITGDHASTAKSVAYDSGLISGGEKVFEVTQSQKVQDISSADFESIAVFARVMPHDKKDIIKRYKDLGYIVGMSGDGVNDVPSLAEADISIAMGHHGTDVAKEAADIVLLDDKLETIVNGINQGRHIFSLLKRVVLYFFATNMAEILIIFFALGAGLALPLTAMQILWLNLVTDGLLTLALAMEPVSSELLYDQRGVAARSLVDRPLLGTMLYLASVMALGSIVLFCIFQSRGVDYARTVALVSMALFQMWTAWTSRSRYTSLLQMKLFDNMYLVLASLIAIILQVMIVHISFLRNIFRTVIIDWQTWVMILLVSLVIIITEELRKFYLAKKG